MKPLFVWCSKIAMKILTGSNHRPLSLRVFGGFMIIDPLDRTVTSSFSFRPKYLDHGLGIVTARLLPMRIIFLVCSCGVF